jgi:hypothetical protein
MHESLGRACVVRYRRAQEGRWAAAQEMLQQRGLGFYWVPNLSQLLEEYEADRETYPTFESFFPRVIEFFNEYADSLPERAGPTDEKPASEAE